MTLAGFQGRGARRGRSPDTVSLRKPWLVSISRSNRDRRAEVPEGGSSECDARSESEVSKELLPVSGSALGLTPSSKRLTSNTETEPESEISMSEPLETASNPGGDGSEPPRGEARAGGAAAPAAAPANDASADSSGAGGDSSCAGCCGEEPGDGEPGDPDPPPEAEESSQQTQNKPDGPVQLAHIK